MINAGSIGMPLHFGKVPRFLTERMGQMGDAIVESIVYNYGKSEVAPGLRAWRVLHAPRLIRSSQSPVH